MLEKIILNDILIKNHKISLKYQTEALHMIKNIRLSLQDIAGKEYITQVIDAAAKFGFGDTADLQKTAEEKVDFFPESFARKLDDLLEYTGKPFSGTFHNSASGAGSAAFDQALHKEMAPLAALGCFRAGENGKLAVAGKSEHYQASLGHNFPGYKLLHHASLLGITNLTHNNTRGHLTRLLERELVRCANGIAPGDESAVDRVIASTEPHTLNRVINLETGSLACEAAFKMMLSRFYKLQNHFDPPVYSGKIPVFLVMADYQGGREANYHGTTIFTQMLRGMWGELYEAMEKAGLIKAVGVKINDWDNFRETVEKYDQADTKVAGFIHELVLMNYGGIRLQNEYLHRCHQLCAQRDIPVFVDEIQSCMWSPQIFLFKDYGLKPDFVSVGKGFPGGMYPASKILTTPQMDNLNLFGALVTNGQEELASLANLITLRFAEANAEHTAQINKLWQEKIHALAEKYPQDITNVEGDGLLTALFFADAERTVEFCKAVNAAGVDISAQTYKAYCPPAALLKLPLISSEKLIGKVISIMDQVLDGKGN